MAKPRVSHTSTTELTKKDEAETPDIFVRALEQREGITFDLDVFATKENAKAPRFYTPEQDGYTERWDAEYVWANPPYSGDHIGAACRKALVEQDNYVAAYLLLPPNTDVGWFQAYAPLAKRCIFVGGRIQFIGDYKHGNDDGSLILVFSPHWTRRPWPDFWTPSAVERGGKGRTRPHAGRKGSSYDTRDD
jgi:phage N-6-adenine-methyltransferase